MIKRSSHPHPRHRRRDSVYDSICRRERWIFPQSVLSVSIAKGVDRAESSRGDQPNLEIVPCSIATGEHRQFDLSTAVHSSSIARVGYTICRGVGRSFIQQRRTRFGMSSRPPGTNRDFLFKGKIETFSSVILRAASSWQQNGGHRAFRDTTNAAPCLFHPKADGMVCGRFSGLSGSGRSDGQGCIELPISPPPPPNARIFRGCREWAWDEVVGE